jgi:hypothetical protein
MNQGMRFDAAHAEAHASLRNYTEAPKKEDAFIIGSQKFEIPPVMSRKLTSTQRSILEAHIDARPESAKLHIAAIEKVCAPNPANVVM